VASPIGEAEVRYASSGRSHIVVPSRNTPKDEDKDDQHERSDEGI
jgi:hypothetical protein